MFEKNKQGRHVIGQAAFCLMLLAVGMNVAKAQEAEPNDFVPAPAGTNLAVGYYVYGHNTDYSIAGGPTVKGSSLEVNLGIARYVHFTSVFGLPAGYQILDAFGSESGGHIGAERLGSAFGASSPELSAFIWPYASTEKKQYFVIAGFLTPPIGTYDKGAALNLAGALTGSVGWSGDAQFGWDQGIGDHFSYDLALDVRAFADTTAPGIGTVSKNPDFRLQAWANWRFNPIFEASIGWEAILGGAVYNSGVANGSKSEFERIRAAGSMFVTGNAQVLLELNHDVEAVGGFKQAFGATARFVYIF